MIQEYHKRTVAQIDQRSFGRNNRPTAVRGFRTFADEPPTFPVWGDDRPEAGVFVDIAGVIRVGGVRVAENLESSVGGY